MTNKQTLHTLKSFQNSNTDLFVEVSLLAEGPLWLIEYKVSKTSQDSKLSWPPVTTDERKQGLWNSTCFEAFFVFEDGSYEEWNFSPSGEWNCFSFTDYRTPQELVEKSVKTPMIKSPENGVLKVTIEKRSSPSLINLTSVLEVKTNGNKTLHYFAKRHPEDKADFHDKSCFYPLA